MNDIPANFKLRYDIRLLIRCYWMYAMSDFKVFPDIRAVADQDQDYVNDMMLLSGYADYLRSQAKGKTG